LERKLRKNALCLNQSAISNFALYVIRAVIRVVKKRQIRVVFVLVKNWQIREVIRIVKKGHFRVGFTVVK